MPQIPTTPPLRFYSRQGLHRLIPSLYSDQGTILAEVADDPAMLADLILLDGATNDRVQGEQIGLPGISKELVYGIAHARIVNAAFTHAAPGGGRFNTEARGAWYCAETLETAIAEVAFHKGRRLADIIVPQRPDSRTTRTTKPLPASKTDSSQAKPAPPTQAEPAQAEPSSISLSKSSQPGPAPRTPTAPLDCPAGDTSTYTDWLADLRTELHMLDLASAYADLLQPSPVPACYAAPQQLAQTLLLARSNGILYPSVRDAAGICIACFRPALVYHPRPGARLQLSLTATAQGYSHSVHTLAQ